MKLITLYVFGVFLFSDYGSTGTMNKTKKIELTVDYHVESDILPKPYDRFKLHYSTAGLGSNMGTMQPTFRVRGRNFIYTREQNSFYEKPSKLPDTVCTGTLRTTSIDSIINLTRDIKDSLIYNTNIGVMSGVLQYVSVDYEKIHVTFQLHNASNPIAERIVNILNSNIPAEKERLWLFKLPEEN